MSAKQTYQLKITLEGAKPPIWRRILVPSNISLGELHQIVQASMGWFDCHLHQFTFNNTNYGIPDDDMGIMGMQIQDENKYRLDQLLKSEKQWMRYEYDFGDGWLHRIDLEKITPYEKDQPLPYCTKGKRACPPEDCGGIWGYQELIEILKNPKHEQHEEMIEWVGENLDPEAFDTESVNAILAEMR